MFTISKQVCLAFAYETCVAVIYTFHLMKLYKWHNCSQFCTTFEKGPYLQFHGMHGHSTKYWPYIREVLMPS